MFAQDSAASFNDQLLRAKLAALQTLQDLLKSLADPAARFSERARELRLLAANVLRVPFLKTASTPNNTPPPNVPPHPRPSATSAASSDPPPPAARPTQQVSAPPARTGPLRDLRRLESILRGLGHPGPVIASSRAPPPPP